MIDHGTWGFSSGLALFILFPPSQSSPSLPPPPFSFSKSSCHSLSSLLQVDALLGSRSAKSSSSGVQERVLSTMLNEMDGIEAAGEVLVVAATNRPDMLDAAFLRPGRIDACVYVPPPDCSARVDVLRVHVRGMPCAPDVCLQTLAQRTEMFSGAGKWVEGGVCLFVREWVAYRLRTSV